ncbi:MAG TPA: spore cortex-lytic protein [Peptococcaceae bacterium]|nr:spore cortex-lytic protein [Peptococcaceae bacterium]
MEDRRCRKLKALLLSTVIILSVSVQSAAAAPEKSTDNILEGFKSFKETFYSLTAGEDNQVFKFIRQVFKSGIKEKGLQKTSKNSLENEIVFVIEQLPLKEVQNRKLASKTAVNEQNLSRSAGAVTRDDLEILARIIYAEARGESFEGQVAVGAVVLNRVQHPDFPKTIREVIYQPGQFTAVKDKQIELTPDERAYQAAQAALEGLDPSNGALYYYNPKTATDKWIRTRSVIRNIGNHCFCV